jgi:hypothetical protein
MDGLDFVRGYVGEAWHSLPEARATEAARLRHRVLPRTYN